MDQLLVAVAVNNEQLQLGLDNSRQQSNGLVIGYPDILNIPPLSEQIINLSSINNDNAERKVIDSNNAVQEIIDNDNAERKVIDNNNAVQEIIDNDNAGRKVININIGQSNDDVTYDNLLLTFDNMLTDSVINKEHPVIDSLAEDIVNGSHAAVTVTDDDLVGKWVVVSYMGSEFPGILLEVTDDEYKVGIYYLYVLYIRGSSRLRNLGGHAIFGFHCKIGGGGGMDHPAPAS